MAKHDTVANRENLKQMDGLSDNKDISCQEAFRDLEISNSIADKFAIKDIHTIMGYSQVCSKCGQHNSVDFYNPYCTKCGAALKCFELAFDAGEIK